MCVHFAEPQEKWQKSDEFAYDPIIKAKRPFNLPMRKANRHESVVRLIFGHDFQNENKKNEVATEWNEKKIMKKPNREYMWINKSTFIVDLIRIETDMFCKLNNR